MGQALLVGAAFVLLLVFVLTGAWRLDRYEDKLERDLEDDREL